MTQAVTRLVPLEPDPDWLAHLAAGSEEDGHAESGKAPRRYVVLDGPALARELPPLEYVIREIGMVAGPGAPHLVAGYGFAGKTLALQAMALSLADHRGVWGAYRATRAQRVLHVDLEQGERLTTRRYQRLALAMGVDLAGLGDTLAVVCMPALTLAASHEDVWRELMTGRDIVIVDSLRAATAGADENDSGIRAGLDMLGALSESTGCCRPIVIHHARKPGADDAGGRYAIRGSSAIYDACDSVYTFSAAQGEPVLVEHVKARSHGEPTEPIALVISDVAVGDDPRAGVRVAVHGAELVGQQRAEREQATRRQRVTADSETMRRILVERPGLGTRELRLAARQAGLGARDRVDDAIAALGGEVELRDEVVGRSRVTRHYLRGTQ